MSFACLRTCARFAVFVAVLEALALTPHAHAQPASAPTPAAAPGAAGAPVASSDDMPPPPPPPLAPAPLSPPSAADEMPPPPPPPSYDNSCQPTCRDGYVCQRGACVSACNPPCAAGESCNARGECVGQTGELIFPPASGAASLSAATPRDPGAERHDGFFASFTIGLGGSKAQRDTGTTGKLQYSGGGLAFGADVGAAVAENLIIFGRLSELVMLSPQLKINGASIDSAQDSSLAFVLLGPGVSYYFMPMNIHIGAALGIAAAVARDSSYGQSDSGTGYAVDLEAGWEFWVNEEWAFGATLRFNHTDVPPQSSAVAPDNHLTANAVNLMFSATYN